jgi:predicted metal-binding membrane protein
MSAVVSGADTAASARGWKRGDGLSSSRRSSDGTLVAVAALLFVVSTAVTIAWCRSMSALGAGGMPMPGGWTMSMAWMRMPGQTWPGAAATFVGMWTVMMVAMMLPSLVPMLARYRAAVGASGASPLWYLTVIVGLGYFAVWTALGVAIYPLGVALAAIEMRSPAVARAVPVAVGAVFVLAGGLQLRAWKARHLACCRTAPRRALAADAAAAWRHGLRLGRHCVDCCLGWMAILLVVDVMDVGAMTIVAAAITIERAAPGGVRFARATGLLVVAVGLVRMARAAGCA